MFIDIKTFNSLKGRVAKLEKPINETIKFFTEIKLENSWVELSKDNNFCKDNNGSNLKPLFKTINKGFFIKSKSKSIELTGSTNKPVTHLIMYVLIQEQDFSILKEKKFTIPFNGTSTNTQSIIVNIEIPKDTILSLYFKPFLSVALDTVWEGIITIK